jgi:hypothetical protein
MRDALDAPDGDPEAATASPTSIYTPMALTRSPPERSTASSPSRVAAASTRSSW